MAAVTVAVEVAISLALVLLLCQATDLDSLVQVAKIRLSVSSRK